MRLSKTYCFDKFLKKELLHLSKSLSDKELSGHIKSASILEMKFKIFGLCFTKLNDEICTFMPDCGVLYNNMFQNLKSIFNESVKLIRIL